jgi:hypothetical protein
MNSLPFSSLSPLQRSKAATLFQDVLFGASSTEYAFEIDAATDQPNGRRSPLQERAHGKGKGGRRYQLTVISQSQPRWNSEKARRLVQILELAKG